MKKEMNSTSINSIKKKEEEKTSLPSTTIVMHHASEFDMKSEQGDMYRLRSLSAPQLTTRAISAIELLKSLE